MYYYVGYAIRGERGDECMKRTKFSYYSKNSGIVKAVGIAKDNWRGNVRTKKKELNNVRETSKISEREEIIRALAKILND